MTEATPDPASSAGSTGDAPKPSFEERMERWGEDVGDAGERFGKQAEAWGKRVSKDPGVVRAAGTASRVWGLVLLGAGAWFLADVTLGYDMPSVPWGDLWPVGLIAVGLLIVVRGMGRRAA